MSLCLQNAFPKHVCVCVSELKEGRKKFSVLSTCQVGLLDCDDED